MPSDYYLKLDNIEGESQDKDHTGEIEIDGFSCGVSNEGTRHGGKGGGKGRAQVQDFSVTKYMDKSSKNLFQYCALFTDVPNAVISCYKAGGDQRVKYLEVKLKQVSIADYQFSGSGGGLAMEQVTLNFAEITFIYTMQGTDQAKGESSEFTYSTTAHG